MGMKAFDLRERWFHQVEIALSLCNRTTPLPEDVIACLTSVFWQAGWDAPATIDILSIVLNPGLLPPRHSSQEKDVT